MLQGVQASVVQPGAVDISNRVTLFSRCLLMRYSQIVNHYHVLGQNRSVAVVSGERLPL